VRHQKRQIAIRRQQAHFAGMTTPAPRATKRPAPFTKPAHWTNDPAPQPAPPAVPEDPNSLSPTRYGDWEKNGIAIDF
jgi:hypothetical protein